MGRTRNSPWNSQRLRLCKELRALRLSAGLHQEELAMKLGAHQSFVSRYERGERRLDLFEVHAICTACGSSMSALLKRLELE
ncbi:helix-turn-helix domain-containing protein [Sediminicurvatus halobius]|uniref:XRE family transcriptional regulator n=1 Tax=Sediminicurvatus halobius TaxID=2182432 RepID=A0A2U2N2K9_9GAMM|nr:helix-turn-helix transcriptional regulator [Spiribacter halobius]PWG63288.1 XRE family transcriptional regulator [Spiribacter halobius]UEX76635.1 helix-turn-helix domain-containing protein [Spiribacter halobius]